MTSQIKPSPLSWPANWKRTRSPKPANFGKGKNKVSIEKASAVILHELNMMEIPKKNVVISTDLKLRLDGLPYASQKEPDEKGASVWWKDEGVQQVIALDKYDRIADNLWAIAKTIEAMRYIKRWGSGEVHQRTINGFVAIPEKNTRTWRSVLNYFGDDYADGREAFLLARSSAHPDKGGSNRLFSEVNQAWIDAKGELK